MRAPVAIRPPKYRLLDTLEGMTVARNYSPAIDSNSCFFFCEWAVTWRALRLLALFAAKLGLLKRNFISTL